MLPRIHYQGYQNLLEALIPLKDHLDQKNPETMTLVEAWQRVEDIFRHEVMGLTGEELEPAIASRWQSTQTEIYRSLRLLQTDILFLQSSRQKSTSHQRLDNVTRRVAQIINYCKGMLKL